MRRKFAVFGLAGALLMVGVSASLLGSGATQAAGTAGSTFIIPANDGYGIGDCTTTGSSCGKVVADAWCEAQGFARSETFGVAEVTEVTGALPGVATERPISITCGD